MNILFVHRNFPAQYRHLVDALRRDPGHTIAAIGSETARAPEGVALRRYRLADGDVAATHPFARRFDLESRRAEQVLYALSSLAQSGFVPDVILAHPGWGETLPLRTVFPRARLLIYCEFFYGREARDVGFDPEFPDGGLDGHTALHAKNATTLLALAECSAGIAPTPWQRSTFPVRIQPDILVAHEGVDTEHMRPDPRATLTVPSGRTLDAGSEVVTFVARNLEPQRGYHTFMRALPRLMRQRPEAEIVIIGGDGVSYGVPAPPGTTWKDRFLAEVADHIDPRRLHFMGHLPYAAYRRALQLSSAHIYLTYPFVLSWSLVEAMSCGCAIVASDTGPVRDVIEDGENGLLVPFFDADGLADRVTEVLRHKGQFRGMRQAARRTAVEGFDLRQRCLPQMMRILQGERPALSRPPARLEPALF